MAISGDVALIGSHKDDDHGSAYVFRGVSDCNANYKPDECDELGDFNGDDCCALADAEPDGDVDLTDYADFRRRLAQP